MVMIEVGSPKMARELLCAVQTQIAITQMPSGAYHGTQLQNMIDQLDVHRPLGVDGKHGELHTPTCGCDPETVEQFLQRKIDRSREAADFDYSLYDSGYYDWGDTK